MKTGIVGFAGSGKTTVFNSLTGMQADTGFGAKGKANLGLIKVPDERIDRLSELHSPKKTTYAEIEFVDVAGPAGKSEGGLNAAVMDHISKCDALVLVLRGFDNPAVGGKTDPAAELGEFQGELMLSDLIKVEKRLERLAKEGGKATTEIALMKRLQEQLEGDRPLRLLDFSDAERQMISGYQFVSLKPCLVLLNLPEDEADGLVPDALRGEVQDGGMAAMAMSAAMEAEIAQLDEADQAEFLADIGLESPARARFIATVYGMLDLISFLTTGPDECRAWTIRRDTPARSAAGKVHSDIERGFIRAEVIAFADFDELESESRCKEQGKMRLEGKDYVVRDGDIINFRFNV